MWGNKTRPRGQTQVFSGGSMHSMRIQRCTSWPSLVLSYRLDGDGPPWKSLWVLNSPTENALSVWCDQDMSKLKTSVGILSHLPFTLIFLRCFRIELLTNNFYWLTSKLFCTLPQVNNTNLFTYLPNSTCAGSWRVFIWPEPFASGQPFRKSCCSCEKSVLKKWQNTN